MTVDIDLNLSLVSGGLRVRMSKAPHILVAGMTGSGKSVFVHHLITQIITRYTQSQAALVLIDPKRVEYGQYKGVPHLPLPPIYDAGGIESALGWAVSEMHSRFSDMEAQGIRDVTNAPVPWSRIIIFIDELANLMLGGSKAVERSIVEIASMGRAAGVHLVLATQRPSADVITGLIRVNVPTRVCLPVLTKTDSRIVLDEGGGETLSDPGAMLVRLPGQRDLMAGRCPMVTDADILSAVRRSKWTPTPPALPLTSG